MMFRARTAWLIVLWTVGLLVPLAPSVPGPVRPADRFRRSWLVLLATVSLLLTLLLLVPGVIEAQTSQPTPTRDFTRRFGSNTNGDILLIGNTLMTCAPGSSVTVGKPPITTTCAQVQDGANFNNNSFTMVFVDVDTDSSTFNSSTARLTISPDGPLPADPKAEVLFAALYWTADTTFGNPNLNRVKLATPKRGYAAIGDISATGPCDQIRTGGAGNDYQCFADVTAIVQADRSGDYTVANVQATANAGDQQAGWALVVVTGHPSLPLRNLTVFDGFETIRSGGAPAAFTVAGFLTPRAAT